jgi:hypothetical protein
VEGAPGQGAAKGGTSAEAEYEDYYDDEAKPDRLTEMLKLSKFNCGSVKKDGYYADDSLNCEVFHYCQEGKKHSWMCPEGFGFHQVKPRHTSTQDLPKAGIETQKENKINLFFQIAFLSSFQKIPSYQKIFLAKSCQKIKI